MLARTPMAGVLTIAAALGVGALAASAQAPAPTPTERLSWQGDPAAPKLSGVWVRTDPADAKSKEGWGPWPPPLKAPFVAQWRKETADAAAGKRTDDPIQACLPPGMPRFVTGTNGPMLILQTPGRVMLYRDGDPVRRIWLDGHPFAAAKDLESFSNGNARGRYTGGDLVTEIRGVKEQPIDGTGVPHSDALTIAERYHRVDDTTLKVEVTLTDPKAYTRPLTSTIVYKAYGDPLWEPKEVLCTPGTNYHPEVYVR